MIRTRPTGTIAQDRALLGPVLLCAIVAVVLMAEVASSADPNIDQNLAYVQSNGATRLIGIDLVNNWEKFEREFIFGIFGQYPPAPNAWQAWSCIVFTNIPSGDGQGYRVLVCKTPVLDGIGGWPVLCDFVTISEADYKTIQGRHKDLYVAISDLERKRRQGVDGAYEGFKEHLRQVEDRDKELAKALRYHAGAMLCQTQFRDNEARKLIKDYRHDLLRRLLTTLPKQVSNLDSGMAYFSSGSAVPAAALASALASGKLESEPESIRIGSGTFRVAWNADRLIMVRQDQTATTRPSAPDNVTTEWLSLRGQYLVEVEKAKDLLGNAGQTQEMYKGLTDPGVFQKSAEHN